MDTISKMAERQIQRHQVLQDTIRTAGFSTHDLADHVNPQNLEPKSRELFIQLTSSIQAMDKPLQAKPRDKGYDGSFNIG
jgi:hypothetical protein